MTRYFAADGTEIVLQNSGHTYDSSLWQLLWPLTTGGQTVLPAQGEFLNLQHTIDSIAHYAVTTTDFVSSIFNALVAIVDGDEAAQRKLSSLRHVIVGGEEINPHAVHRMRALLPDLRVTNGYGPTETSIGMIFHPVSRSDGAAIPLGRPIDNCHAVIVDDKMQQLPPGAVGEIAIGGACVGAGYYANPAATRTAFVPNPFPAVPGDRLYLSGDLGYTDDHGQFFFSGRKDFQVKVGGVRIELGEIEAAAHSCPGVQQAVTLLAEQDGARSLAMLASGPELTEPVLRDHLRRTLPRTSLPRYYIVLPAMPLTDGGKADRRELQAVLDRKLAEDAARLAARLRDGAEPDRPAPDAQGPGGQGLCGQPVHDQTLRAFRLALGQPDLTAEKHFLDAGGDSIQALSAVRALTSGTGYDVCVQDLFDYPTAAQLALLIESRRGGSDAGEAETALMDQDAALPGSLLIRGAGHDPDLRAVLVTGPTGFIGPHLVHGLLTRTELQVHCLARAADDAQATIRVIGALAQRGLWEPRFARLSGYAAQLGQPDLGLAPRTWQHLARTCDLVLHNGALVNLVFGYRAHRLVNVRGTTEVLRLALGHRPVPVHYVSTLAAFQPQAGRQLALTGTRLPERYDPARAQTPVTGYARSKWVAERQLAEAARQGATVTVLRLGEVMPGQQDATPNAVALTHLLLSAIHRLGAAPDAAIVSDYSPVDYVAARVTAAVLDRDAWGRALHVFRPGSVRFDDVLRRAGESSRSRRPPGNPWARSRSRTPGGTRLARRGPTPAERRRGAARAACSRACPRWSTRRRSPRADDPGSHRSRRGRHDRRALGGRSSG